MSAPSLLLPLCSALLIIFLLGAGCTSNTIGDVAYKNGTLEVLVTSTGDPEDAFVQVTVYEIRDFQQKEVTTLVAPVTIQRGENVALVPGTLAPGKYKLYVYILKPDERQTATIRDIEV
jgi:hypothetical protein